MSEVREALSISTPLDMDGSCHWYQVGNTYNRLDIKAMSYVKHGPVTKITITEDLPGLHGFLERARVYDGDTVIFEAPVHSLEGISYAPPEESEE